MLRGCAFCDLRDLSDDWGLLNLMTGGSHDRGENDPAARAYDRGYAHPRDGRQSPEGAHPGGQGFCAVSETVTGYSDPGRSSRLSATHDRYRCDADDVQRPDHGAEVPVREDLRARGDEEVHAIPYPAPEVADGAEYRRRVGDSRRGTRPGPQIPRGAQHFLWRGSASVRGLQPQDQRYRQ